MSGGRCRFYVSLSSLATALCRFPNLSHPLPRAWVAFVRIRQMAPPRSVGPNEKELQLRMRSWQHQPGTSRVGLNFAGGLSKAKQSTKHLGMPCRSYGHCPLFGRSYDCGETRLLDSGVEPWRRHSALATMRGTTPGLKRVRRVPLRMGRCVLWE